MSQVCDERRIAWVERVRELVVARGPVRIVACPNRFAGLLMHDEPVGMLAHHARITGRKKRCSPDAGLESGGANFSGDLFEPARKLGIGRIPIAERGLKTVVELNYLKRKLRTHRLERFEIRPERVFGDRVKVVVPGTPSALELRADPRIHPSARCIRPSRGEARGGLFGGGQEQRIDFAMPTWREGYIVENCACDYFVRTRHGECRNRSGGADESGEHALGGSAAFDDRKQFRGLRLGEFERPSSFALMIDARDEVGDVARMGARSAYIITARRA